MECDGNGHQESETLAVDLQHYNIYGAPCWWSLQQYYDRSEKQKEEYQAYLDSQKSESDGEQAVEGEKSAEAVPHDPRPTTVAELVQNTAVSVPTQSVRMEVMATRQVVEPVVSGPTQSPPTPLQPRVVVGGCV